MNRTVAWLTARSLLGMRRSLLLFVLPVLLLLLAGLVRWAAGPDPELTTHLLAGFALGTLVPLLCLIAGTGAIGPEIDDGSIIYLLAKPVSRFTIVITKLVVALGIVLVFSVLPTLLAGLVLAGWARQVSIGYALGAAVAGLAYCALFLMLAVLSRHAVVIGLLYAVLWESVIGRFVPGAQDLSVQQWALAVVNAVVAPTSGGGGILRSAVGAPAGAVALAVVAVGATGYAGWRLRSLRLTGEQ